MTYCLLLNVLFHGTVSFFSSSFFCVFFIFLHFIIVRLDVLTKCKKSCWSLFRQELVIFKLKFLIRGISKFYWYQPYHTMYKLRYLYILRLHSARDERNGKLDVIYKVPSQFDKLHLHWIIFVEPILSPSHCYHSPMHWRLHLYCKYVLN